jgi:hypothetical protein
MEIEMDDMKKKPAKEIARIELDVGILYDFELLDGSVVRLRYEGRGQWQNPATGDVLPREPQHNTYTAVV